MALLVFAAAPALLLTLGIVLAIAISPWWWVLAAVGLALTVIAVVDFLQPRNSILRNFPLLGHARFLLEEVRPMIQQYFIERNWDGKPFDRDARALIYDRSEGRPSVKSFGTCAAIGCGALFVDLSCNRSKRFCDRGNCANRTHVAAFRARMADDGPSG